MPNEVIEDPPEAFSDPTEQESDFFVGNDADPVYPEPPLEQSDAESDVDEVEEIRIDENFPNEPQTRGRAVNTESNFMSGRYIILMTRPINPDIEVQVNQCALCQGEARLNKDHTITFGLEKKLFRNAFYDLRGDQERNEIFIFIHFKVDNYSHKLFHFYQIGIQFQKDGDLGCWQLACRDCCYQKEDGSLDVIDDVYRVAFHIR